MRPHILLDVRDAAQSVAFYEKVFGVKPQKQVQDHAKFDVKAPLLNFSQSSTGAVSAVDHLRVEVDLFLGSVDGTGCDHRSLSEAGKKARDPIRIRRRPQSNKRSLRNFNSDASSW